MTAARFDPEIHAPLRLQICAYLAAVVEAEFSALAEDLEVSDSALSKQLTRLGSLGYVSTRHATSGGRRRLWLALTPSGKKALTGHLLALQELAAKAGITTQS